MMYVLKELKILIKILKYFDINVCKLTNLITSFTIDEIKSISDNLIYLTSYSYTNMHVIFYESSLNDYCYL